MTKKIDETTKAANSFTARLPAEFRFRGFTRKERLSLSDLMFAKLEVLTQLVTDEYRFQALASAYTTLVQARRLDEGNEDGVNPLDAPFQMNVVVVKGSDAQQVLDSDEEFVVPQLGEGEVVDSTSVEHPLEPKATPNHQGGVLSEFADDD